MNLTVFHPQYWSRYSRRLTGDKEALRKYKRVILLSQFALFGSVIGVIHALEDLADGVFLMPMMDFIMACFIFICYILNESGRHRLAKIVLLTFLNVFFFIYSSLVPREIGTYLYYISWVGLAATVFEVHENALRIFYICLSIFFLVLLFVMDFNAFDIEAFAVVDVTKSFVINLVSSIIVLAFFIIFMSNMNEESENRLMELAQEVSKKNIELEKANRELDRFFFSASHDLKIPLMDMKGIINSGISELQNSRGTEYFALLHEKAQKLENFLDDILDYSRNSQIGIQLEPVDIEKLIDDTINNFRFVKGVNKIRFEKIVNLTHPVEIDRVRMMIILNNLISNATKYHRLDDNNPWVKITADYEDDNFLLSIEDNGQGMEPDLLPKIFNMFFRGTNQSKGSGLGLYIVKESIEKMGGTIAVQSQVEVGSLFTVKLPLRASSPKHNRNLTKPL